MNTAHFDVILASLGTADGDTLDLLLSVRLQWNRPCSNVLVLTEHRGHRLLASFRKFGIAGMFDPVCDDASMFPHALRSVLSRTPYWSESLRCRLDRPQDDELRLRLLTPTEELVLGILGDGTDDERASEILGMTASTIKTIRKSIYSALRIHEKWELIRTAERLGFVRFTHSGTTRLGLGLLLHAYQQKTQRPVPLSGALAASYPELARISERRSQLRDMP